MNTRVDCSDCEGQGGRYVAVPIAKDTTRFLRYQRNGPIPTTEKIEKKWVICPRCGGNGVLFIGDFR